MPACCAATTMLWATRLPCPFSIRMPSRPRKKRFPVITFRLPGPRVTPAPFRTSGCVSPDAVAAFHEDCPSALRENRFPLIRLRLDCGRVDAVMGVVPERVVQDPDVMRVEHAHPAPLAVRAMPFPELFRTRLGPGKRSRGRRTGSSRRHAQHAVVSCPTGAVPNKTPAANSRTEPCITVTPSWPSLTTPKSQVSCLVIASAAGVPSPSTRWPFRSSVTLSAPITIPLFGQLTRSLSSVVSAVIVSPQLTWLASARPPPIGVAPEAATPATRTATSKRVRIGHPFGRVQCPTYCVAYTRVGGESRVRPVSPSLPGIWETLAALHAGGRGVQAARPAGRWRRFKAGAT